MDQIERVLEPALPPCERFFNRLTNTECSEEDYAHAQLVWRTFNCRDMAYYLRLYLATDIGLLADVFERFRDTSMAEYEQILRTL